MVLELLRSWVIPTRCGVRVIILQVCFLRMARVGADAHDTLRATHHVVTFIDLIIGDFDSRGFLRNESPGLSATQKMKSTLCFSQS